MSDQIFKLYSWPRAIVHIDGDAFFTSCEEAIHPELRGRHHIDESIIQKSVKDAVTKAGLVKRATAILSDILLPRTCWKTATTYEQYKNFWVIRMSVPP